MFAALLDANYLEFARIALGYALLGAGLGVLVWSFSD